MGLARRVVDTSTPFGLYARITFVDERLRLRSPASVTAALWPCPPPFKWRIGKPPTRSRQRQRWKSYWAICRATNVVIMALSRARAERRPFESDSAPDRRTNRGSGSGAVPWTTFLWGLRINEG